MTEAFIKRGYNLQEIESAIEKARIKDRPSSLQESKKTSKENCLLITTYNRTLPNVSGALKKHWNLLQLSDEMKAKFQAPPMIAYKRNRNIGDILNSKIIENNIVKRKNVTQLGKCKPCDPEKRFLCCKQMKETSLFKSQSTGRTFKIFNNSDCKTKNTIYLMECSLCNLQYVGMSTTTMSQRIAGHRSDSKRPDSILADIHFQKPGHNFNEHATFTIIETPNISRNRGDMINFLKNLEDRWMLRLRTIDKTGKSGLNVCTNQPQAFAINLM